MALRNIKNLIKSPILVLYLLFLSGSAVYCQDWAKSYINQGQRVDLRDLGYPEVNEIPANSSAVTSLITAKDGLIYGATTGDTAYLFLFDPAINKVRHLGKIKGEESVYHSLVEDNDGSIYLGTGKNNLVEIPLSKGGIGKEYTNVTLWRDIRNYFKDYPGGHLYRYSPKASNHKVKLPDMECELADLGIPVPGNSIYTLAVNPARGEIYGISYPDGHFFIYNIAVKTFKDLGSIDSQVVFNGPERCWRSLPRALVLDDSGRVFTSGTEGKLVYYDPSLGKIVTTDLQIPQERYPIQSVESYAVVEYFVRAGEGIIYGGSSDGYLFSFDPAKMELFNLGKPNSSRRLRALALGKDGKVYLMAGERSTIQPCQLFSYDPGRGNFQNLGLLIVDRSPYYYWRGYQFDCMTTGRDGTIYFGESERRSHLFLYIP